MFDLFNPKLTHLKSIQHYNSTFACFLIIPYHAIHSQITNNKQQTAPILPALEFPKLQVSSDKAISDKDSKGLVDVNSDIRRWHVEKILKRLCKEGDDEQYVLWACCVRG